MKIPFQLSALLLAVAFAPAIHADQPVPEVRLTPADLVALAGTRAPGVQMSALIGNSSQPGLYSVRVSIPAHTRVQPHTHRDNRAVLVLSGTWHMGYGTHFAPEALKALPAGSFYTEPAGQPHFAETQDEPVVLIVTGYGPSNTHMLPR
ncbi:MAG: cupin domain-containing protein [Steroidobacteraceae bacterium]